MSLPLHYEQTILKEAAPQRLAKSRVQQRFDKASRSYTAHNQLQARVSAQLLSTMALDYQGKQVERLLDLGCGPGVNTEQLRQYSKQYIGADLSSAMLNRCREVASAHIADEALHLVQADMDHLPFSNASIDVLFSSLAVQWSQNTPALLSTIADMLKPKGSAFISTLSSGSLEPLASLRRSIDDQAQVNEQASMLEWRAWLSQRSEFDVVTMTQQRFTVYSPDLNTLLRGIKGVGAGASRAEPLTRSVLQKLQDGYEAFRCEQGLPLHYEVIFIQLRRRSEQLSL